MYRVNLLQSLSKPDKSYVGRTIRTLSERLKEHNDGLVKSTKAYVPWKVVYFEQFYCDVCSDKREIFLKSGVGYRLRKLILENHLKLK